MGLWTMTRKERRTSLCEPITRCWIRDVPSSSHHLLPLQSSFKTGGMKETDYWGGGEEKMRESVDYDKKGKEDIS